MKASWLFPIIGATLGLWTLISIASGATTSVAAPDWWVGPPEEFQRLLEGAQKEGEVTMWGSASVQGKAILAAWPKQWRIKFNFVDCVERAEKEKWVESFRKDIGFE